MQTTVNPAVILQPYFRKLEDLTNELAYLDLNHDRGDSLERAARRISVLQAIKKVRWLIENWLTPIEDVLYEDVG